jgi:hypothetical protein
LAQAENGSSREQGLNDSLKGFDAVYSFGKITPEHARFDRASDRGGTLP